MRSAEDLVRELERDEALRARLAVHRFLPPREARYGELEIAEPLRTALAAQGIERLWTHQVEAIEAVRRGENVVVMTPTASGKSLVYNVPVVETLLADPSARALYVFPLKGLEQDQVQNLRRLLGAVGLEMPRRPGEKKALAPAEVYDGDTPAHRRKKIRDRVPPVVFTNPDMIHLAINAYHDKWAAFFRGLRYVVVDEVHIYRGVFGSNAAHVFRRLRRIARYHGAEPRWIACSATIANPEELAETLVGVDFRAVTESGAPQSGRHFFFVRAETSPYTEATNLFVRCLRAGLRTIVFTKARKITELIHRWTVERAPDLADRVSPYRAGFLPAERREIESRLFRGELLGVVSTSALELGVDIGGLDVAILVGYPGSIASTWQRAGRVGRHGRPAAIFLVALADALDQYFLRHPEAFFGKSHEAVVVDPENPYQLEAHLVCAAAEVYLRADDAVYDVGRLRPVLERLVAAGALKEGQRGDIWFSRRRLPQREVPIRAIGESVAVVHEETGQKIGELGEARVLREAFPGAIYLHWGRQYRIVRLDLLGRRAYAREVDVRYYTQALTSEETEVLAERAVRRLGPVAARRGSLRLTHRVVGYERRDLFTGERLSRHELDLPPRRFDTEGLWLRVDRETELAVGTAGYDLAGTLHAAEHVAIKSIPLFVLCDAGDVGGLSYPYYPPFGRAAIFVYDGHEGGIGYTERVFASLEPWLGAALRLLAECPCEAGCPSCVQDPQCGSGNEPLDKEGARFFLERLLEGAVEHGPRPSQG